MVGRVLYHKTPILPFHHCHLLEVFMAQINGIELGKFEVRFFGEGLDEIVELQTEGQFKAYLYKVWGLGLSGSIEAEVKSEDYDDWHRVSHESYEIPVSWCSKDVVEDVWLDVVDAMFYVTLIKPNSLVPKRD